MNILVSYDINTQSKSGVRRLNKIAKVCLDYGQRVQNSVYECELDSGQLLILKKKLLELYNSEEDSIRIYKLGKNYEKSVLHYGIKMVFKPEQPIII